MIKKSLKFENIIFPTWFNSKEAASYLRITEGNLRVLVCRGIVKAYKFNNRNRFNREELDNLVKTSIKRNLK